MDVTMVIVIYFYYVPCNATGARYFVVNVGGSRNFVRFRKALTG